MLWRGLSHGLGFFVGTIEIGLENGEKLLSFSSDRSFQIIMKCKP